MKSAKIILIAFEVAMLFGVVIATVCTDWEFAVKTGNDALVKSIIVLCALCAVVMQREQQQIKW